jgi:hypothetical protein
VTRNVTVGWLALLLRIREIPCSNNDLETGYRQIFSWFDSVLPSKCPDDGGRMHLWNVGKLLPDYMVQQPRIQPSSLVTAWNLTTYTVTWVRVGTVYRLNDLGSIPGRYQDFFFSTMCREAMRSTQSALQWDPGTLPRGVKEPERETDHTPPSCAVV